MSLSVTVWNEGIHEQENEETQKIYPDGIGTTIANFLAEYGYETRVATMDEPEHGMTESVLEETDVLLWWGHVGHWDVDDEVAERVATAVRDGMGFIPLHSSHYAKPFLKLMGTDGDEKYREAAERERLWVVDPGHPIVDGLDEQILIEEAEMYGEPHNIPEPDELVFISWFEGGEVFRSGCCWRRQRGRIFYFRPGHETYPVYHNEDVQQVLANAVAWAAPNEGATVTYRNTPDSPEPIDE